MLPNYRMAEALQESRLLAAQNEALARNRREPDRRVEARVEHRLSTFLARRRDRAPRLHKWMHPLTH